MEEQFIKLKYSIVKNRKLGWLPKVLYSLIAGFKQGDFIASNEYVAELLGVEVRTIQRALKTLEKADVIYRKNVYSGGECVGRIIYLKSNKNK